MKNELKGTRAALTCATLAVAAGLVGWTVPATAQTKAPASNAKPMASLGCSAEQIEANRSLPRIFAKDADPEKAYPKMATGYIQHNPIARRIGEVNGLSGADEFKLLLEMMNKGVEGPPPSLPGQPPEDTYHYIMADCDHVFVLKKNYLPDPQHKGQFYEAFDFDFWRIEDGKLAEHWDSVKIPQNVPKAMQVPYAELLKSAEQRPAQPKP